MGDHRDVSMSESAEYSTTTPPVVPSTTSTLPPFPNTSSSSGRRNRSVVWDHFTPEPGSEKRAKCNHCGAVIKYADGTSAMNAHLKRCKVNPSAEGNKRKKTVTSPSAEGQVGRFDLEAIRNSLVEMFVSEELPFRFVESKGFRKLLKVLQPRFNAPSRVTLARDIITLYEAEKIKLHKYLSKHCGRVCLTTDNWTSVQNLSYMCLTAHFIDNDWKLQKKILNFCQVKGHTGVIMAKSIEVCLNDWKLNQVLSLTVDNATSNDLGVQYLKKRLISWNSIILRGEYIHMRCCAHILSLIVKDGLKEINDSIIRIRSAVKYVRSSPSRLAKFKGCVEQEKIQYKGLVCLDVDTRWNSTYLMLEAALKHQKAFDLLELQDKKYVDELSRERGKGVPSEDDWDYARSVLPFLKMFYDCTIRISGTNYITSNLYMKEVFAVGRRIEHYCKHSDLSISRMASKMKDKYDKYWRNPNGINMLLLIAVVVDPCHKLDYVNWCLDDSFGSEKGSELKLKLSSCLRSLFNLYQGTEEGSQDDQDVRINEENDDIYDLGLFRQSTGRKSNAKSELDRYLNEECEPDNKSLDILSWWKANSTRFPILANMAREVLAIPVSTVASECAFSTGGRILDPYRSSLTPKMVEALVCTQDWLKGDAFSSLALENFEELEKIEQELISSKDIAFSAPIALDDD